MPKFSQLAVVSPALPGDFVAALRGYSGPNTGIDVLIPGNTIPGNVVASAIPYTPPGSGAVLTTVGAKLAQSLSVFDFMTAAQIANVEADLLTIDVTTAINMALTAAAALFVATVHFPSGSYLVSATLNRPAGVFMVGDGAEFTAIVAAPGFNGNIIATTGTALSVQNRGGVQNLAITGTWGANHANTASVGISESFTNRAYHRDVRIHGCNIGMYGIGVWQDIWDNIQVDGDGTQQNNFGFYLDQLLTTFPVGTSNAVNAVNCTAQGVLNTGFRLLNPNGSKFVDCEAENGINGFWIGTTSAGCYPIQFAQFTGCVSDTNSGIGFLVQQGSNAAPPNYMQFANCWASTHGNLAVFLDGCAYLNLSNFVMGNNSKGAITLNQCQYCILSTSELLLNNTGNIAGIGDITIAGGSFNRIIGNVSNMANATSVSCLETAGANNNYISENSLFQGATLIGSGTRATNNAGYNPVGVTGPTTVGASPFTYTAGQSPETHYLSQSATFTAVVTKASKTLGVLTSGTTLPVQLDPGGQYSVVWLTTAPTYVKDVH